MRTAFALKSVINVMPKTHGIALFPVLFILVATVITAPLAVIDTPLLADYPNHVARMHIIGNVDDDLFLVERYGVHFEFIPNIIMDLMVPWLAKVMPLDVAARFFLASSLVSTLAGVAWLHRTLFNQWSLYPLVAALFVHHGSMMAGMVNFSLGIGLVPAALAVWIRITSWRAEWRLLIGSLLALSLFFCHLVAAGAYSLLVIGYTFAHLRDGWRKPGARHRVLSEVAITGMTGLLPVMLFLRLILESGSGSGDAGVVYGNIAWKLKALLAPLANYNLALDLISFAFLTGLALVAWRKGWLTIDRRMAPGLALLATAFVLAPKALWTGGVFDQRLAVLLPPMLIACSFFEAPGSRMVRTLPVLLAMLLLLRVGVLTSTWIEHRADLAEMRQAIALMAPGGRVLVVRPDKGAGLRLAPPRHRVFHHAAQLQSLPALAVIEKSAFVSTLYALPGQQPFSLRPPYDRLGGRGHVELPTLQALMHACRPEPGDPLPSRQIRTWTEDFDYVVLIYGYGSGIDPLIDELPLELMLDGEILDLFRIVREEGDGYSHE